MDDSRDHRQLVGGPALVPAPLELRNPGHPVAAYGLIPVATQAQGFFAGARKQGGPIAVVARVEKGVEHDWFIDVLVRGLTRLEPHKPVSHVRTGDDLLPSVRVLPSFVPAGGWDRVDARVEIERPLIGFNTLITRHRGKADPRERKPDSEDPRARVLVALEESRGGPFIPTHTETFPLFDDGTNGDLVANNAYWSAQLSDLTTADGMYRYRFVLDFEKNGCTTRRELAQSVFVEVGVDPQASDVSVAPAQPAPGGRSRYDVRIVPRDARGNLWGFGRAGAVACAPESSCACTADEVTDHGDGSYTVAVVAPPTASRCRLETFGARFELALGAEIRACSDLLKSVETAKIGSPQLRHRLVLAARQKLRPADPPTPSGGGLPGGGPARDRVPRRRRAARRRRQGPGRAAASRGRRCRTGSGGAAARLRRTTGLADGRIGARRRGSYTNRLEISISEVSVRWTGHLSAISSRRRRCSSVSSPRTSISRSIWSSLPSLVSQRAQSSA